MTLRSGRIQDEFLKEIQLKSDRKFREGKKLLSGIPGRVLWKGLLLKFGQCLCLGYECIEMLVMRVGGRRLRHRALWRNPDWAHSLVCLPLLLAPQSESCSVVSDSLWPQGHGLYPVKNSWNSPGQNTGVGSFSPPQGIFPTQGSNPGLPHCRRILYQLNHKGNPRILEWVVYPFSSGSSQPRNRTGVSCIVGGFFTNWTVRGTPKLGLIRDGM